MKDSSSLMKSTQFITFILTGGIAALINISSRYFLTPLIGFNASIVLAYLLGMTTAWGLARTFVFASKQQSRKQEYLKFAIVNIFALFQVWGISWGLKEMIFPLVEFQFYPENMAHIIGVIFPVFTSYFGHKYYTFKAYS